MDAKQDKVRSVVRRVGVEWTAFSLQHHLRVPVTFPWLKVVIQHSTAVLIKSTSKI
jgi:hypothetical protein